MAGKSDFKMKFKDESYFKNTHACLKFMKNTARIPCQQAQYHLSK